MSSCELGHRTEMYGLEAENSEPSKPSDSGPELSKQKKLRMNLSGSSQKDTLSTYNT